jgi:hypothetical protein
MLCYYAAGMKYFSVLIVCSNSNALLSGKWKVQNINSGFLMKMVVCDHWLWVKIQQWRKNKWVKMIFEHDQNWDLHSILFYTMIVIRIAWSWDCNSERLCLQWSSSKDFCGPVAKHGNFQISIQDSIFKQNFFSLFVHSIFLTETTVW